MMSSNVMSSWWSRLYPGMKITTSHDLLMAYKWLIKLYTPRLTYPRSRNKGFIRPETLTRSYFLGEGYGFFGEALVDNRHELSGKAPFAKAKVDEVNDVNPVLHTEPDRLLFENG